MKTIALFVKSLVILMACFVASGCASVEKQVYVATGTLVASVNAAKDYYDDLVAAGKITPEKQAKVERLLASYQKALSMEERAIHLYRKTKDKEALNRAYSDLKDVVKQLLDEIQTGQPREIINPAPL